MKIHVLTISLLLFSSFLFGQNIIEWDRNYKLALSDFQSTASEMGGNMYSLHSSTKMEFSFYMSNYEFMFTKNFNSKVNTTFTKNASSLIAPDQQTADQLLKFAQFEFDLTELYSRKFRKRLYEEKGAFSNINFCQPIYQEIEKEYVERHGEIAKITGLGREDGKLKEAHQTVLREIEELGDYCKTCKPPKKSKKG